MVRVTVSVPDTASTKTAAGIAIFAYAAGATAPPAPAAVADISPASSACSVSTGGRQCAVSVAVPAGDALVAASTYDQPPAAGKSAGKRLASAVVHLNSSSGSTVALSTSGAAQKITFAATPPPLNNPATRGTTSSPRSFTVGINVTDASGNTLLTDPSVLQLSLLQPSPNPVVSPATASFTTDPAVASFTYNGRYFGSPMTLTAAMGDITAVTQIVGSNPVVCSYDVAAQSVMIPFPNIASNIANGFSMSVAIGGGAARNVLIDTGSTGLIIAASAIGPQAIGPGSPGSLEYSSDGKIFNGFYYLAPVTLNAQTPSGGISTTTVPLKILGVTSESCDSAYPNCTIDSSISGVGNMGVAFDRPETIGGPVTNAFLQLASELSGAMHPGYIVSGNSITLGLTASDASGFTTINLTPSSPAGDWIQPSGCFNLPGKAGPFCGQFLVDTGLGSAILALDQGSRPAAIATADPIPNGYQIQFGGPTLANGAFAYAFTTGDSGPLTPPSVRWSNQGLGKGPFFNTGRHAIAGYDYMYDPECGRVGFRPSTATGAAQ